MEIAEAQDEALQEVRSHCLMGMFEVTGPPVGQQHCVLFSLGLVTMAGRHYQCRELGQKVFTRYKFKQRAGK